MRFEFHDLAELNAFIEWADAFSLQGAINDLPVPRGSVVVQGYSAGGVTFPAGKMITAIGGGGGGGGPTHAEIDPSLNAEGVPPLSRPLPPAPTEEPTKRKRRTKAEIEADKAAESARLTAHNHATATADASLAEHGAEAAAAYAKPETTPAGTTAKVASENTGNPFAQQSLPAESKPDQEKPAEQPKAGTTAKVTPENTSDPFAQQSLPAESKPDQEKPAEQPKAAAPADATPEQAKQFEINEFVAARLAERPTLEQREHLLLARTFIGKHGMPKYNESFQLVGLSPNVMTYTEADCARHAAALDFLGLE